LQGGDQGRWEAWRVQKAKAATVDVVEVFVHVNAVVIVFSGIFLNALHGSVELGNHLWVLCVDLSSHDLHICLVGLEAADVLARDKWQHRVVLVFDRRHTVQLRVEGKGVQLQRGLNLLQDVV
jgi:hypothetical protein